MLVSINKVTVTKQPKGWSMAEVEYVRDGKTETRKVPSFADETVFNALVQLNEFPVDANITLAKETNKKDGKEYWQWKGVETGKGAPKNDAQPKVVAGKVLGSNYETPAERAKKQVYIVRQSTINMAIALHVAQNPKGAAVSVEEILKVAGTFEAYVFDQGQPEIV
jgi:hypothetical protein